MSGTDLYRFYDNEDRLLYVGISLHAAQRASEHRGDKSWWPDVERMHVTHLEVDRAGAHAIERQTIIDEKPIHNITHNTQYTVTPVASQIVWTCEICSLPIDDGKGYIEMPHSERLRYEREKAHWETRWGNATQGQLRVITGEGLLHHPRRCHWWSIHRDCDSNPSGSGYWIDVSRARTHRDLLNWSVHLMEKRWMDTTDWTALVHKHTDMDRSL